MSIEALMLMKNKKQIDFNINYNKSMEDFSYTEIRSPNESKIFTQKKNIENLLKIASNDVKTSKRQLLLFEQEFSKVTQDIYTDIKAEFGKNVVEKKDRRSINRKNKRNRIITKI